MFRRHVRAPIPVGADDVPGLRPVMYAHHPPHGQTLVEADRLDVRQDGAQIIVNKIMGGDESDMVWL